MRGKGRGSRDDDIDDDALGRLLIRDKRRLGRISRFECMQDHSSLRLRLSAQVIRARFVPRTLHDAAFLALVTSVARSGRPALVSWSEGGKLHSYTFGLTLLGVAELCSRTRSSKDASGRAVVDMSEVAMAMPYKAAHRFVHDSVQSYQFAKSGVCRMYKESMPLMLHKLARYAPETGLMRVSVGKAELGAPKERVPCAYCQRTVAKSGRAR